MNSKIDRIGRGLNVKDKVKFFEGEEIETKWDPKKIVVGAVILAVMVLLGAIALTGVGRRSSVSDHETLGVTEGDEIDSREVSKTPQLPSSQDIERIIRETRETISNITAENLTSSQAAIQKMIQDLEILQGKKDAKDIVCDLLCKK